MAAESWWCWPLLSAWLSSGTACFLFFNAVICAVAVLSSSWGRGGDATTLSSTRRKRLTRSASSMVMERLRSMSATIFSFHSADEYDSIVTPPASQLYCYTSQEGGEAVSAVGPEPAVAVVESMPSPPTPSAPVAVAAEVCAAASTSGSETEEAETEREEMSGSVKDACAAVARRQAPETASSAASERPRKWKVAERRAYAESEEKAEVNARAERFIRQFRQDLKLERLNSILNCGRAAAAPAR